MMDAIDVRSLRVKLGLTQAEFWKPVGVTQSGGCRYENGRRIPGTVQTLITIIHAPLRAARRAVRKLRPEI